MKWLHTAGLALAGILIAVGFSMIGRAGRRQKKAETREIGHLIDGSEKALKKAAKENAKAETARQQAADAASKGRNILDKVGSKDDSIADIVGDWNTDRLR